MIRGKEIKYLITGGLALVLAASLVAGACAPAAPPEVAEEVAELEEEIADLEDEVAAKDREIAGLEGDVGDLEDEVAALKKPAEVYQWDMTYPLYRGTWDWEILERWCADLKVASDGRLDMTPYAGGEIMPVMETFEAVSTGTLNIDFSYGPYWTGKLAMAIYSGGLPPFTLPRWEHYKVLYYKLGLEELLREAYAEHNIYYVATMPTDCTVAISKSPIRKAADFQGMKLRATGIYAELVTEAGASAVFFPWGEIYGALETGLIDGVLMGGGIGVLCDAGFHEPCNYFLETPITPVDAWALHVNMDAWNELPDDLQMLLYESTSYAADLFTASYFGWDAVWTERIVEEWGYTITTLPVEEQAILSEYSITVLDKYSAEDPIFAEATAILKKYMKELGLLD